MKIKLRSYIIGGMLAVLMTMSGVYITLRMNAFMWASILTALMAISIYKILKLEKDASVHEINIAQTAASTGGILAAGICFTIPAIHFLDQELFDSLTSDPKSFILKTFVLAFVGGIFGVLFSAYLRKNMIIEEKLPFAIGEATADTIRAGEKEGGRKIKILLSAFGLSAIFTALRDGVSLSIGKIHFALESVIPVFKRFQSGAFKFEVPFMPMAIGAGYLIGYRIVSIWFLGCLFSYYVFQPFIHYFYDVPMAQMTEYVLPLGVGAVIGGGIIIFILKVIPSSIKTFKAMISAKVLKDEVNPRWIPVFAVLAVFIMTTILDLTIAASILAIIGIWVMTALAGRLTGEVSIDPMEVFAVLIVLFVKIAVSLSTYESIFIAAIAAVSVGVAGDLLFDLKAGHMLGTSPKEQAKAQMLGVVIGSLVVGISLLAILNAFDLGSSELFALQAQSVAYMLGAIDLKIFLLGAVIGTAITLLGRSGMVFGVGIFIPLYLSVAFFIGGAVNYLNRKKTKDETERLIASGLIGGEGVVGALLAIIKMIPLLI
ncbi:MAG: OPT/YSL family transporter [Euryarchaeota archaeon]|nr:OPT/YSL family transporter [Euryarchaeota archaeon]